MTTSKALAAPLQTLNRSIAPAYRSAAPDFLHWQQEKEFFRIQIARDWKIAKAIADGRVETIESAKQAARECAAMGLTMNPAAKLVYFIPRRARKKWDRETDKEYDERVPWLLTATPSYMGLAFIGTRYGGAELFAAEIVYQVELDGAKKPDDGHSPRFILNGPIHEPMHRPTLDNRERIEAKAAGAYAVVVMKSGRVRCEYIDAPTIQKIRSLSEVPNSLMWTKLWTEGWKKAAIRRIAKLINTTEPRMLAAIDTLDRNEGIVLEHDDGGGDSFTGNTPPDDSSNGSQATDAPPAAGRTRRSAGLSAALNGARRRYDEAELAGDPEPDYAPGTAPAAEASADPDAFVPVDSRHPDGSIEWFGDQLAAATTRDRLEEIKLEALHRRIDTGPDADSFREMFARRAREIRNGSRPAPGPSDPYRDERRDRGPDRDEPEPGDLFGGALR